MSEDKKAQDITDKGAVELQEEQLDDAAGGILIGLNQPTSSFTVKLNPVQTGIKFDTTADHKLSGDGSVYKI